MRAIAKALLIFSVFLFPFSSASAQQTSGSVDPKAATILAGSLRAMGGVNLAGISSTQMTVQVTDPDGTTGTATILTQGFRNMRMDWHGSDGDSTFVTSATTAASEDSGGHIAKMSPLSAGEGNITNIPLLSILGQWTATGMKVTYIGEETMSGGSVYHIRIERPLDPNMGLGSYDAPCDLYISAQSLLPVELVFPLRAPADLRVISRMTAQYSNYQSVSGILIPYKVTYSVGKTLMETDQVTQFAINVATSSSDFQLGGQ